MNYSDAVAIRLRAAERKWVDPDELAEANEVVAANRKKQILVHPAEPLPFNFMPKPSASVSSWEIATGKPKTRCQLRCHHLGVCQSFKPCSGGV